MFARSWALGLVCSLVGMSAGATTACTSKSTQPANNSIDTHSDDPESDAGSKGIPANSDDEDVVDAGDAGASQPSGPTCLPTAVDDPDDTFADSNCDGIDGDKSKAVFVATTGSDTAEGSWGKPVATLKHAIDLALASGKDVYACAGDYPESISINNQGIRIYGGYDCTQNWKRDSNSQARLVSQGAPALVVSSSNQPVTFDHVDFDATAGTAPGSSAVAVFVSKSSQVTIRRSTVVAHDGLSAAQPAAAPSTPASTVVTRKGNNASKTKNCGVAQNAVSTCAQLTASGFTFALPGGDTWNAQQGTTYCPTGEYSVGGGGGGTDTANCYAIGSGTLGYPATTGSTHDGLDGASGPTVSNSTLGFGSLDATGYQASNIGQGGIAGKVGQGGTGGRGGGVYQFGSTCDVCTNFEPKPVGGGGQGGPGGCGGLGGASGNAGGASIAVSIYQSNVTIERSTLQTGKGGSGSRGGDGAAGVPGVAGGASGTVTECGTVTTYTADSGYSQTGGHGGHGGAGSPGGAGGGGPSIPLVTVGTAPTLTAVTFLPGSGGVGGSNSGVRAADGDSTDQKVIP